MVFSLFILYDSVVKNLFGIIFDFLSSGIFFLRFFEKTLPLENLLLRDIQLVPVV